MSQCARLFSCGDGMHGKITHPSPTSLTYPAALYMLVWCHTVLCTARRMPHVWEAAALATLHLGPCWLACLSSLLTG